MNPPSGSADPRPTGTETADASLALSTHGIRKVFPGLVALDDVDLAVGWGEVHAIVGQNGAGKSTLVKILTGVYRADAGEVLVGGKPVTIRNPQDARAHGIEIVHQDQAMVPQLTVARNAFLGRELRNPVGLLDIARMRDRTDAALRTIRADFTASTLVEELSVAQRMQAAIAAALVDQPQVLILDEPTASLGAPEAAQLFAAIRAANESGVTIIYISHRLGEITGLASVCTVLRDGKLVGRLDLTSAGRDEMIKMMIGRELSSVAPKEEVELGDPVLEVHQLATSGTLAGVNLTVRAGEIVGLAGLVGSGTSEVALNVFGAARRTRGSVRVNGQARAFRSPRAAARAGVALVPEDRRTEGILANLPIRENLTIASTGQLSRLGWMDTRAEHRTTARLMEQLSVAATGPDQAVGTLSGGNQQKVMLGRWLARGAALYIFDEPTAGVDVGSKVDIYRQLGELARDGAGLLVISSDFEELLGICDRILVLVDGRVTHELSRGEVDLEGLTSLAAGGAVTPDQALPPDSPSPDHAFPPDSPSPDQALPPGNRPSPGPGEPTPTAPVRSSAHPVGSAASGRGRRAWWPVGQITTRSVAIAGMLAILAVIAVGSPGFLHVDNLMTVLRQGSVGALIACALTVALVGGGIDLSVGGVAQVSANAVAWAVVGGFGVASVVGLGVLAGLAIGLINGVIIYVFRVPSFVATLGMLFLLLGASLQINSGLALRVPSDHSAFLMLGQGYLGVVPVVTVILVLTVAGLHTWMRWTGTGGRVYASGSSPDAAVLRGVSPRRYTLIAFGVSGAVAGFAGVLSASYSSGATASDQSMLLLVSALSAAFLGSALSPTREFNVVGAAVAAMFISAVSNGLILNGVSNIVLPGVQGAVLLAAVLVASVRRRRLGQVLVF